MELIAETQHPQGAGFPAKGWLRAAKRMDEGECHSEGVVVGSKVDGWPVAASQRLWGLQHCAGSTVAKQGSPSSSIKSLIGLGTVDVDSYAIV
jgi:hypothetical protein